MDSIDLQQFHVWEDAWADDDRWQRAVDGPEAGGLVRGVGISVNRWEPSNVPATPSDTGLIDVVQVIYNIFDQAPEDELFPLCQRDDIAVIARVPFDEGTLTGTLTGQHLAGGRLAQHLLRAGEPAAQRGARRRLRPTYRPG